MVAHEHDMGPAMAQVATDEATLVRYRRSLIEHHDAKALATTMKNVESQLSYMNRDSNTQVTNAIPQKQRGLYGLHRDACM